MPCITLKQVIFDHTTGNQYCIDYHGKTWQLDLKCDSPEHRWTLLEKVPIWTEADQTLNMNTAKLIEMIKHYVSQ